MRKFHLRKYSYLVLWLALFSAVAGVWFFGGSQEQPGEGTVQSSPQAGPTAQIPQEEEETEQEGSV